MAPGDVRHLDRFVYATVGALKGKRRLGDTDDPSRIVDCLDDAEWNRYVEDDYVEAAEDY